MLESHTQEHLSEESDYEDCCEDKSAPSYGMVTAAISVIKKFHFCCLWIQWLYSLSVWIGKTDWDKTLRKMVSNKQYWLLCQKVVITVFVNKY